MLELMNRILGFVVLYSANLSRPVSLAFIASQKRSFVVTRHPTLGMQLRTAVGALEVGSTYIFLRPCF